jgi:hypothetical protein
MIVDGHVVPAWLAWAVAVLALAGTWACFAVAWQGVAWLAGRRRDPGNDDRDDRDWREEMIEDETRRQLEALPPERDWSEITGQQPVWHAAEGPLTAGGLGPEHVPENAPWTGLSGPLGPAGPPVPYTTTRQALSALLAEYERREPAWLHECRVAYACLGLDDPTLLRALR